MNATQRFMLRDTLKAGKGIVDTETRLDYAGRADSNPVYVGRNDIGTATSDETWIIERLTYDANSRPTRKQVLVGAWDNRATLSW